MCFFSSLSSYYQPFSWFETIGLKSIEGTKKSGEVSGPGPRLPGEEAGHGDAEVHASLCPGPRMDPKHAWSKPCGAQY